MKSLFTLLSILVFSTSFAQKTEFRFALNSGLFHFTGASAENTSQINYSHAQSDGYTNNPYGAKNGFCYGLSSNLKRISRHNFITGIDFGLELLQSKIEIDKVWDDGRNPSSEQTADGRTYFKFAFLNASPFLGWRINLDGIPCDLTGGFDIAYCFNNWERGKATTSDGTVYKTTRERNTNVIDIRPRFQLSASYKKYGAYIGYSIGLPSYKVGYMGGTNEAFSRLFRFGLTYQMN
jgi:hypothetical protein